MIVLHVGPSLNSLLYDNLLRFRENRVVLVGDTEKGFLNSEIDREDRDCLRFLWLKEPPDLSEIVVYRFCRVVFVLTASPFLLNATSRYHISKNANAVDDLEFVRKLLGSLHVDDYVGGRSSSKDVAALYGKTGERMLEGGFKLRKWHTNDASVRSKIETTSNVKAPGNAISQEDTSYAEYKIRQRLLTCRIIVILLV